VHHGGQIVVLRRENPRGGRHTEIGPKEGFLENPGPEEGWWYVIVLETSLGRRTGSCGMYRTLSGECSAMLPRHILARMLVCLDRGNLLSARGRIARVTFSERHFVSSTASERAGGDHIWQARAPSKLDRLDGTCHRISMERPSGARAQRSCLGTFWRAGLCAWTVGLLRARGRIARVTFSERHFVSCAPRPRRERATILYGKRVRPVSLTGATNFIWGDHLLLSICY
jgi:hypothetical protein